ncbi:MAG: response regulator [Planctomycetes bacterium]|nr:response regulator [Planctomycetota bacterium]
MPLTIDHFRHQHKHLLALADQLETLIDERNLMIRAGDARAALMRLGGHLRIHLAAEDESLYPTLRASAVGTVRGTAERFSCEVGGLAQAFGSYADAWSEHAVRSDAGGFARATKEILGALRHRIRQEDEHLYPLIGDMAVSTRPHAGQVRQADDVPSICIVDDSEGDLVLLSEAWREIGSTIAVRHYATAAQMLSAVFVRPLPDLVIIDIHLPIVGGVELLKTLRTTPGFEHVPIVMCSSTCDSRDAAVCASSGATGFFPKPATFPEYLLFVKTMNDLIDYQRNR